MVYVISKDGVPLMPTNRHGKVRHLLEEGKAKVVSKEPFTIKLLYDSTLYTQDLTLGVDTGSGTFATAVTDNNNNVVYTSEVQVRNDITDKMKQRAKYRRNRRNHKTRYRKARFLNRKNSKKLDGHSPTMKSKLYSHIKEIEYIKSILPISKLVLETATFDTHLMKNPNINRHWGYQKGLNYSFENTKAMVLNRDNYKCQFCKGKHKDSKLEVHHIIFRSKGGSDEQDNLITLCHTCHKNLHDDKIKPNFKGKTKGNLKYATQMNEIRSQLLKHYPEAIETFGFITKANRLENKLPKEHYVDACMIASCGQSIKFKTNIVYCKKSVAKGDYQRTKGVRSEIVIPNYKIQGFNKFDKVLYKGNKYFIKGRYSTGYAILMNINGVTQKFINPKIPKMNSLVKLQSRKTTLTDSNVIKALNLCH